MKSGAPYWQSIRLLDQVQCLHYSLEANKNYLYWIRFFIQCNAMQSDGMHRPPQDGCGRCEGVFLHADQYGQVSVGDARNPLDALAALAALAAQA